MGEVCFGAVTREVCLVYTPDLQPGRWVIVHAGFSINSLDEAAAIQTLDAFRQLEAADIRIAADHIFPTGHGAPGSEQ